MGHVGEKYLQTLVKQGVLKGAKTSKLSCCEHCILGKQTWIKFEIAIHNTQEILDYAHSDVWEPPKIASLRGKHFFITFEDDYSCHVWVNTMKNKDGVLNIFLVWRLKLL